MILITGGAGFIGSNLAAALAEKGRRVVVCDRLGTGDKWRNLAKHDLFDLIAPEQLKEWLRLYRHRLDAVLHFGAISDTTERDVDRLVDNNCRLSLDLWRWCAENDKRLIYASSAATYGDGSAGFDDDCSVAALARLRPLNAYGWSKHMVDRWIARAVASREPTPPQWVGLKLFNVYGPNEYHKGAMRSVVVQNHATVRRGEPLRLFRSYRPEFADGEQQRDFVYVRDCVDLVLWLVATPAVSGLFNVGTGEARSFLDLARALFAALGREPRIEFIDMPPELRERYQYFTQAPIDRLRRAGYDRPFTPLEQGVADYVRGYLEQADPYR